jgi:calcineurin-like phosphoesterase family protein
MIHFISDTHFSHRRICEYSGRPFSSVEEMNEALITNWNQRVQPTDTVYHLGDFSFSSYDEFKRLIHRLHGKIHIILGNHDKMIIQHREELLATKWKHPGIGSIQYYLELKAEGQLFCLFHYGCRVWRNSHHGSIMLYGHSHGSLPPHGKSVDVGVDCKEITPDYRPISITEVIAYMSKRQGETVDHHENIEEE